MRAEDKIFLVFKSIIWALCLLPLAWLIWLILNQGLTANPAEFTSSIVANSTLVALMNDGLARPLDSLVAKHGGDLAKSQLITVDGKIMAVA